MQQESQATATGGLIISLDFEKFWGIADKLSPDDAYVASLERVEEVVSQTCRLFLAYGTRATWATVGLLSLHGRRELEDIAHRHVPYPGYADTKFSAFAQYQHKGDQLSDNVLFSVSALNTVMGTAGQELGSHTFSHIYVLEKGLGRSDFAVDLALLETCFSADQLRSIVFPRNQINDDYLELAAERGAVCFRENQRHWAYASAGEQESKWRKRVYRYLDRYFFLGEHYDFAWNDIGRRAGLWAIPQSRFLAPFRAGQRLQNGLMLRRIKGEMLSAARKGKLYHLWWHPHNFGADLETNLSFLEEILRYQMQLDAQYGWPSYNMGDISERLEA